MHYIRIQTGKLLYFSFPLVLKACWIEVLRKIQILVSLPIPLLEDGTQVTPAIDF